MFEIYTDEAGELRWRFVSAANGRIIFEASEGYREQRDLDRSIEIARDCAGAPIKDLTSGG